MAPETIALIELAAILAPGCVAFGSLKSDTKNTREALSAHIERDDARFDDVHSRINHVNERRKT